MKVSSGNKALQTIMNKVRRKNIVLTHKLQRREGAWSRQQKSLLIDSLLRGYPVNPVYTVIDNGVQAVIDGVQRLSTCYSFINDGFTLSKKLEPLELDGNIYEIAGKKFSKLDEPVQDELMSSQIQVYEIAEYTDKEVREMFKRLNSGKSLNSVQQMTPYMSDELSNTIVTIISHPIFEKVLTESQMKSSFDQSIAIETLMLSEMGKDYDFGSFSRGDKEKFILYYNDKINEEKINLIIKGLDKLDESFDENVKIPKSSISFVCYGCYRILKDNKDIDKFVEVIKDFIDNYDENETYKSYLMQGTNGAESVKNRLEYWRNIIREL